MVADGHRVTGRGRCARLRACGVQSRRQRLADVLLLLVSLCMLPVPERYLEDFKKQVAYLEETLNHLTAETGAESESHGALAVSESM